ncbi:unnamed protein product [Protopolystoma xenopodis]|uniref:Uncharacterized protein n=1 Tax=Protopolystoma xenopodis TaxID=117903 RepID=A0A448X298_9PLAT|nr:unnamed protein product [Protopolystoma xenopodis]
MTMANMCESNLSTAHEANPDDQPAEDTLAGGLLPSSQSLESAAASVVVTDGGLSLAKAHTRTGDSASSPRIQPKPPIHASTASSASALVAASEVAVTSVPPRDQLPAKVKLSPGEVIVNPVNVCLGKQATGPGGAEASGRVNSFVREWVEKSGESAAVCCTRAEKVSFVIRHGRLHVLAIGPCM